MDISIKIPDEWLISLSDFDDKVKKFKNKIGIPNPKITMDGDIMKFSFYSTSNNDKLICTAKATEICKYWYDSQYHWVWQQDFNKFDPVNFDHIGFDQYQNQNQNQNDQNNILKELFTHISFSFKDPMLISIVLSQLNFDSFYFITEDDNNSSTSKHFKAFGLKDIVWNELKYEISDSDIVVIPVSD